MSIKKNTQERGFLDSLTFVVLAVKYVALLYSSVHLASSAEGEGQVVVSILLGYWARAAWLPLLKDHLGTK